MIILSIIEYNTEFAQSKLVLSDTETRLVWASRQLFNYL